MLLELPDVGAAIGTALTGASTQILAGVTIALGIAVVPFIAKRVWGMVKGLK